MSPAHGPALGFLPALNGICDGFESALIWMTEVNFRLR